MNREVVGSFRFASWKHLYELDSEQGQMRGEQVLPSKSLAIGNFRNLQSFHSDPVVRGCSLQHPPTALKGMREACTTTCEGTWVGFYQTIRFAAALDFLCVPYNKDLQE